MPHGSREALAEVGEQRLAPAARHFGQADQRVELLALHLLEGVGAFALRDPLAQLHDILNAVGHPGVGGLAVAAGAAGFLIVGLDRFRQIEMRDEAHVRLVDAHAEGDGRDDDEAVVVEECVCAAARSVGVEPGVIGERLAALARTATPPSPRPILRDRQ